MYQTFRKPQNKNEITKFINTATFNTTITSGFNVIDLNDQFRNLPMFLSQKKFLILSHQILLGIV